jgi:bifunctional non-homologous end joining protein LigD
MLATLTDHPFSRKGWLFEPKWDGERCLAFGDDHNLRLFSRNRKRLNEKYPEIAAAFRRQGINSFIADGEIVAFKDDQFREAPGTHAGGASASRSAP